MLLNGQRGLSSAALSTSQNCQSSKASSFLLFMCMYVWMCIKHVGGLGWGWVDVGSIAEASTYTPM